MRTAIEPGDQCPVARYVPSEADTSTTSPSAGDPVMVAIAPEKIHGWYRLTDWSLPFLSVIRAVITFSDLIICLSVQLQVYAPADPCIGGSIDLLLRCQSGCFPV